MVLQSLLSYLQRNKKTLFFITLIVWFWFSTLSWVFAAAPSDGGTWISQEDANILIWYLNLFLKAAAALLALATSFVSIFLYPGWVNGTMFGLQDYLREIWILVSNVIYFIFAGILITIAFMNIIGKWEGTWELKQAMPRFIVGVLIVPFSWFAVQFLLSLSAILTVWVLTLPYNSFQQEPLFAQAIEWTDNELTSQEFCKNIIINFSDSRVPGSTDWIASWQDAEFAEIFQCKDDGMVTIKEIISWEWNAEWLDNNVFWVISVYTYWILRLDKLDTIESADLNTIKGIADLLFKVGFDLLFVVIYMLLMVALFLALLTRGIRLWVFMMLSPVFGLLYFLWKTSDGGWEKFSPKEFIALAFVPVYVAAALAFGLTFILVASTGLKETTSEDDMDTLNAWGFSISIVGAHWDGEEEVSVIWKLIVELFGVVILWIAVMAALKQSATTKAIIEPIVSFWESVGKLAAASPTYAPIIPTWWWERMGISGLRSLWSSLESWVAWAQSSRWSKLWSDLADTVTWAWDPFTRSINALTSKLPDWAQSQQQAEDLNNGVIWAISNLWKTLRDSNHRQLLAWAMWDAYTPKVEDALKWATTEQEFARIISDIKSNPSKYDLEWDKKRAFDNIHPTWNIDDIIRQYSSWTMTNWTNWATSDETTINIQPSTTITWLVENGAIKWTSEGEKDSNIQTISNDIVRMLDWETRSRTKMKAELVKLNITDIWDQDKIIDALDDSIA